MTGRPETHSTSDSGISRRSHWLAAAVCGAACVALFQFFGNPVRGYIDTASLFYWWGYQWVNPASEGEHGWLVLGLSGWVLWKNLRKSEIESPKFEMSENNSDFTLRTSYFAALAAGLALHALGFAAQQTRVCIVGFLLCAWGVLRLGGGPRWGRAALFPLGFMLFAIPLNLLDSVGFTLRVWVVDASAAIARAAGIGVLQSGTLLVAPDGRYNYDVAAACSGVRSLTALVALSLLAGYLNFAGPWRRVLVMALCLPLVYLGNVVRIVAIVVAAQAGGPKWGDIAHDVMGYGIFVIVLGGVLLAIAGLRRWWPEKEAKFEAQSAKSEVEASAESRKGRPVRSYLFLSTAIVVVVTAGEMVFLHHLANLPSRGQAGVLLAADGLNPVDLPAFLGTDWMGQRAEVSPVEREVLPDDTGFSRRIYAFVPDRRQDVFLSVVLSGRDRSSIHRPELCLVGQGWTIKEAATHAFQYPERKEAAFNAKILRVGREVQTPRGKETVPQLVAYWFVGGDQVVSSHLHRMLLDAWNRVVHLRADRWAYVVMQTDARDGEAAALARMQTVLDATLPAFQRPVAGR